MKKRDIEKMLHALGWWFERHGGNHDVWTNGQICEFVPRHAEVGEMLAKKIIRKAKNNPPEHNEGEGK